MTRAYTDPREVLVAYRRREVARELAEGALALSVVACASLAALVAADVAFRLSPNARMTLSGLAAALVALAAVHRAVRLLVRPRPAQVAAAIEARSPVPFASTLVTAVEYDRRDHVDRYGFSHELVAACRASALAVAGAIDVPALSSMQHARRLAMGMAGLAALWAAAVALRPDRVRDTLVHRYLALLSPGSVAAVRLAVAPGDTKVLVGSALEVRVGAQRSGRGPEAAGAPAVALDPPPVLRRRVEGAAADETIPMTPAGGGQHAVLFPNVVRSFRYRIDAGPFESPSYRVRVVEPPRIVGLRLRYRYPPYTRQPDQVQDRPPYDVAGPEGTVVSVRVTASKPLASGRLVLPDRTVALDASSAPTERTGSFAIAASGQYAVEVTDTDGFTNPAPDRHHVLATPDTVPTVVLLEPGRDLSLKPSEITTIPIRVDVADDHGIRQVTLRYKLVQKAEYDYVTSERAVVMATPKDSPLKLSVAHVWDLTRRVLQPGDSISYWVEAGDHAPGGRGGASGAVPDAPGGRGGASGAVPDPAHVGVSRTFHVRVPYTTEVMAAGAAEQEKEISGMEDVAARQKALEEKVDKVLRDVRTSREVGYKERKELEQIVARQKEIREKAQEVGNRMKETLDRMARTDPIDPGALSKLAQIQRLFHELADSKLKENMERLRELMQGMKLDPERMARLMSDFDRARYSKELDRVLKSLKRMKQLSELDRAARQAGELARKQEDLRGRTTSRMQDRRPTADLARDQDELARETERLVKSLPQLASDTAREFPESAGDLDRLRREARSCQACSSMSRASSGLSKNEGAKAYQEQSNAAEQLRDLEKALRDAREKMRDKQVEIDLRALVGLIHHGVQVSALQQGLQPDAGGVAVVSSDLQRSLCLELAGRQYTALRGVHLFEKQFESAFSDDVMFKNAFLAQIGQLAEEMEEAKRGYEEVRPFSARQLAERSLSRLNMLLARLIEALSQMKDQSGAQSAQSFFDQMEKLIDQQRKLNERAQRLKPDDAATSFLMQMMQQMAAEQEMIRRAIEDMAAKYDRAKNILGDLKQLSRQMNEVEEALKRFDRTAQTRAKQDRILTRMLDYARSQKKQGQSEKRESQSAGAYAPRAAPPLSSDLTDVKQRLHENLSRESYPPQHKRVVEDYFSSFGP
jgi:tetratricopeptide (TPR) repeat protein